MGACFSSSNSSDGPRRPFDPHGRISTEIGTNRRQSTGTALTGLTHENERTLPFQPRSNGSWHAATTITRSAIEKQRLEFWETASMYDGRIEIWNLLKTVVGLGRTGDVDTAQAMLYSAGITLPTGDLGDGCFDMQGARYLIPQYCLCDPDNVIEASDDTAPDLAPISNPSNASVTTPADNESHHRQISTTDDDDKAVLLTQEHNETVSTPPTSTTIKVKVRISSSPPQDITLNLPTTANPLRVKREIIDCIPTLATKSLKLILLGKLLDDHKSVTSQGWSTDVMLQAFVGS